MRRPARLHRFELTAVALASAVLSIVMNWPLALDLNTHVAGDFTDPSLQAWEIAWGAHALLHQPFEYFQANAFWPLRDSLAFSDALVGYAPIGLVGQGVTAALVHYNLLYLFAYASAAFGAYLLAHELGARSAGAAVAGVGFAYAPWRLAHVGHLNVLSSGGIPLSLYLLVHGYRHRRPLLVVAGWLVATWQLSLGFNLGLQFVYALAAVALAAGLTRGLKHPRRRLDRPLAVATIAGVSLLIVCAVSLSRPYLRVVSRYPEARRSVADVSAFSPLPWSFLAAPEKSVMWGRATASARTSLRSPSEQTLFPGLAVCILAALGIGSSTYPKRVRITLAATAAASAAFSLGLHTALGRLDYLLPYRLLYEFAPGWQGVRTPGRLNTMTSLALALLAAAGAERLLRVRRALYAPTAAVIVAVILLEGAGYPNYGAVPPAPADQLATPGPQVHLPTTGYLDPLYMYWSTDGFPAIVNGASGVDPLQHVRLRRLLASFPDPRSVSVLRSLGVRTVVLHQRFARKTPWAAAASRSVRGLGISRKSLRDVILYRIRSQPPDARMRLSK